MVSPIVKWKRGQTMDYTSHFSIQIEKDAWESFEVGSYDDVLDLEKKNFDNAFINHLSFIVKIENNLNVDLNSIHKGTSILSKLIESFVNYKKNNKKEALKNYITYLKAPKNLLCLSFFQYGIQLSFELEEYKACLYIIDLNKDELNDQYYYKEKVASLFALKKYTELIQYFKKIHSMISLDQGVYLKTSLSLQALGKYKESELLLKKVPNLLKLPSFEEKKEEIKDTIQNISQLECKKDLNPDELKELGFAYLFNSQYEKAEELFKKATVSLAAG
jgi:tetratricopeptide (TPR) repeat protein